MPMYLETEGSFTSLQEKMTPDNNSMEQTPAAAKNVNDGTIRRCFHEKARIVKGRRGDPNPNCSQTYALLPRFHPHS
jgi:hypothetical protein